MTTNPLEAQLVRGRQQFLGFVQRRISDPDLAEDILQDGLLRATQAAPRLRNEERLVPWFYRILSNAVVDFYRRKGREPTQLGIALADSVPVEPADHAALCACLEDLLPTLKPEYAELIQSPDLGEETPESIANRLGVTANNLKVRHHRARQGPASPVGGNLSRLRGPPLPGLYLP